MNFKIELKTMQERMFTVELLDEIQRAYQLEVAEDGLDLSALAERAALCTLLNEEQRAALDEAETLCTENMAYALRFAFSQGVYAGFEQLFASAAPEDPFETYIVKRILTYPGMALHTGYCQKREQINGRFAKVEQQFPVEGRELLTDLQCAWDNRLYGVLRYGFYLGYRYAFSILDTAVPAGGKARSVGKLLQTEHALDFLHTLEEQEREKCGRARRAAGGISA